jgi:hypothetical protein
VLAERPRERRGQHSTSTCAGATFKKRTTAEFSGATPHAHDGSDAFATTEATWSSPWRTEVRDARAQGWLVTRQQHVARLVYDRGVG